MAEFEIAKIECTRTNVTYNAGEEHSLVIFQDLVCTVLLFEFRPFAQRDLYQGCLNYETGKRSSLNWRQKKMRSTCLKKKKTIDNVSLF